jgi:hypothetical protein
MLMFPVLWALGVWLVEAFASVAKRARWSA